MRLAATSLLPFGYGRQRSAALFRRSQRAEHVLLPTNNWCMEDEPQERTHTNQGTVYVFANVYMYPEKPGVTGKFKKFDVLTGKTVWEIPDPYPNWGGAMITDGGLVFYGSLGGDFRAVDRNTGKVLWSRKLGSGIVGNPEPGSLMASSMSACTPALAAGSAFRSPLVLTSMTSSAPSVPRLWPSPLA